MGIFKMFKKYPDVDELVKQITILQDRGDLDGAMVLLKKAERLCREQGDKAGLNFSLCGQAVILKDRGDLDRAMALFKEAEGICRELGDKYALATSLDNQANILDDRGDLDGMMALQKQVEHIYRELGDKGGLAKSLAAQAVILGLGKDQTKDALPLVDEAYRLAVELGHDALAKQIEGIRAQIHKGRG